MDYVPKRPIDLPLSDFMNLEFHLMATRPGVKPEAFAIELIQRWLAIDMERQSLLKNVLDPITIRQSPRERPQRMALYLAKVPWRNSLGPRSGLQEPLQQTTTKRV